MPPVNDNYASAQTLSGLSGWQPFSNVGATVETGEPDVSSGGDAHATVWFKWTCPSAVPQGYAAIFDTSASPYPPLFDSTIEVWKAGTPDTLANLGTNVAYNDDGALQPGAPGSFGTSRVTFQAEAGATYYVRVGGWNPSGTDATAILRWAALPNIIGPWVQPPDQAIDRTTDSEAMTGWTYVWRSPSNADMWDGASVDPGSSHTDFAGLPGRMFYETVPNATGATSPPTNYEGLLLLPVTTTTFNDVADPVPPGATVAVEYDPTDASVYTSPLTLTITASTQPPSFGSYPADMAVVVKRLPASRYTLASVGGALPAPQLTPSPWVPQAEAAGLASVASIGAPLPAPGAGTITDTLTFTSADADVSTGMLVLWISVSDFVTRTLVDTDPADITVGYEVSYTYRPRRHRWITPSSPVLPTGPIAPPLPALPDAALTAEVRSEARLIPSIRMDGG